MKNTKILATLLFIIFTSIQPALTQSQFNSWLDDNHYLIQKKDEKGENKTFKVEAKSGKEEAYVKPSEEKISDLLPSGINASRWNSSYSRDGEKVVINRENDLHYFSKTGKTLRQLTANPQEEKNPRFSSDGKYVAFTRDHNLYVLDTDTGLERQLTTDGSDLIYNGWASWVYYEEILGRSSRYRAFYWSPDSKKIAFLRFDDHPVPEFPIYHHIHGDMAHGELEVTRYPKPGDPNPKVKLAIADVETGKITWVNTDPEIEYTAWVFWSPKSDQLFFQQMNRDQNELKLFSVDLKTGERTLIYEESQPTWVEFFEEVHFLESKDGFILRSNRDGWYNLYQVSTEVEPLHKITDVKWNVSNIFLIDEDKNQIFFTGTGQNSTESHLFRTDLDGKNIKQLTTKPGTHRVTLSPEGSYFVDRFSGILTPGITEVFDNSGKVLREIYRNSQNANQDGSIKVELFTIPTEDGFQLPAHWVLPPDFDPTEKYPVIFRIYGGPGYGGVSNRYRNYSYDQLLQKGVIRFVVDHRGSGKFGKKGLDYLHRSLGKWEINDYIEAVKWLRKQPFVDSTRIGIQGSSYGGYMSALALTYGADYFTHGVASSSVTDWRLYDNIYTERYMDTPEDNPDGYDYGSAIVNAKKLKGKLLLIHGTIDDNVHLQNTIQFVSKLQDLGKKFELMLYPGGRHGWGGAKRNHSGDLIMEFWIEHFKL